MLDIDYTSKLNFCVVPYIYNEYISPTVSIIANLLQIIMRLKENQKFLVIETPRFVLFFIYVIFSFACPIQNKKNSPRHRRIQLIQVSSDSYALSCSHMKSSYLAQNLNTIYEEWL